MACITPYTTKDGNKVPCGRCPTCLEARAASWVFRLQQEQKNFISAHFVTFTYEPDFLPLSANGYGTLVKSDMQNFMKRLRKVEGEGLKYYIVGEYGSQKNRPHYHGIIFGVNDVTLFQSLWGYKVNGKPFGSVYIDEVNNNTCGYVAGYLMKGKCVPAHKNDDRVKEFALMSKGLGIGYLTPEMIQYHHDDISRVYVNSGKRKLAMPRYYQQKIFADYNIDLSTRNLLLKVDAIEKDEERFIEYLRENPGKTHLDYTEQKNERRKAAYTNMKNSHIAKNKLL